MKVFSVKSILFFAVILAGCSGGYNGQLLGVQDRPSWNPIVPYGMVYIPSGTLHIGPSGEDVNNAKIQQTKSISIQGFYMDDTEITNNEYRQFVNWVRDSIAHTKLGENHMMETGEEGEKRIDWEMELDYGNQETQKQLQSLYYPENEQLWGRKEMDKSKFVFEWETIDWQGAAKRQNPKPRSELVETNKTAVYPDTLVWTRDFSYSYNEPMTRNYFWHPAFDDYPVVGVTWEQAKAFSAWRTKFWNDHRRSEGKSINDPFRLPTEFEWEYAARGGRQQAPYPWGGPYVRNSKGCILANFKPGRGDYPADGGFYTVRADAYWPNDYGLYNMSGNVAEWTSSAFYENAYEFVHDLNPDMKYDAKKSDPKSKKRKTIRGGSWKDIGYYIQTGSRHWEYADSAKSYIGFRNALTFLGRSIDDY